jgi:hypothetical protein
VTPRHIAMLRAHAQNMLAVYPHNVEARDKLALLDALAAAEAREAMLREALEAVLRRSATSATRTLGEASDELAMCQDIARAALATGEHG